MAFQEVDNVPRVWQTDYKKFYNTLKRVGYHHVADILCHEMGSYTNMLSWHESRVKFCVYNFFNNIERAEKVMNCLKEERSKYDNDAKIIKLRKEFENVTIPDSWCYNSNDIDDYIDTFEEDNPLRDQFVTLASKYCKIALNTWEDIRIWAFGHSVNVNELRRAPNIVEIISNILLKYNKQRKLSMTMTDDSNENENGSVDSQLSISDNYNINNLESKNDIGNETASIGSKENEDAKNIDFYKVLRQFIKLSDSENSDQTETKNEETAKCDKKRKMKKDRKEKSKQKLKQKSNSKGNRMTTQDTIYENEAIMYQSDIEKFVTFMSQLRDTSTELGLLYTTCVSQIRQDMINDSKINHNGQRLYDQQSSVNDDSLLGIGIPMPLSRGQSLESNISNTSTNYSKESNKNNGNNEYFVGMNSFNDNDYMLLLFFDELLNFLETEIENNNNHSNSSNNDDNNNNGIIINNGNSTSVLCDLSNYMKQDCNNINIKIVIGWCFIFDDFDTGVMKKEFKDVTICQDFVYYARNGVSFVAKSLSDSYHRCIQQKWHSHTMEDNDYWAPQPSKLKYDDIRNAFNQRGVPMGLQLTYYVRYNGDFWEKFTLFPMRNWIKWYADNVVHNILRNGIKVTQTPKYENCQAIFEAYDQLYGNKT